MSAMVIDESFRGMNRVQQQRAVYAALKGKMDIVRIGSIESKS